MKGLIIKQPWIDLILDGLKTWEIRSKSTSIRGKIALIQSGSGKVIGTVELVDSIPLTRAEFNDSRDKHCIPVYQLVRYPQIHAWVFKNPVRFNTSLPYTHPQGAVIWVNLPEMI